MGLMRLCEDDPLLASLRELFDATPLKTPENRIQPITLLSRKGHHARYLGSLEFAIAEFVNPPIRSGSLAELSGKKTRSVDAKLGLNILGGFLAGFGVPAAGIASVNTALRGAVEVRFSFGDLERRYVDLIELGKAIAGKTFDEANPALSAIVLGTADHDLVVIDSVLRSGSFTLSVETSHGADFSINAPLVESAVKGSGTFKSLDASERTITFKGTDRLTFAFSCAELTLSQGRITGLAPGADVRSAGALAGSAGPMLSPKPFFEESGLLVWEG